MQASMLPLRAQDESDDSGLTDEEILAGEEVDAAVEDAKTAPETVVQRSLGRRCFISSSWK